MENVFVHMCCLRTNTFTPLHIYDICIYLLGYVFQISNISCMFCDFIRSDHLLRITCHSPPLHQPTSYIVVAGEKTKNLPSVVWVNLVSIKGGHLMIDGNDRNKKKKRKENTIKQ